MTIDKSIFGLRFGGNVELCPTQEELGVFLESPKQIGRRELNSDDLTTYNKMLKDVFAFEHFLRQNAGPQDCREIIFYGVLSHSGFFNTALKSEVTYFKYFVHSLLTLDFKKPAAFIKSAKEEMSRCNPNKKESAARLARLCSMVNEREMALEALKKRRTTLADELRHIARYIRDNLVKIEKLCVTSIIVLVDPNIAMREEKRIIEDIKAFIKEDLRYNLHQGAITQQHLEAAKKDVDTITREVWALIREDIYALTRLYEAIYDHAKNIVHEIDALLAELDGIKSQNLEESGKLFAQLAQVLVSLVSDLHFKLETAATHTETAHKNILLEKRKEMLGIIFELLLKERRSQGDRRTCANRRKFKDSSYKGLEHRIGKERRATKIRRIA